MVRCLIVILRVYALCMSPFLLPACRFQPTCSQYAIQVLEKYGIVRGSWLACKRLLRCHPWGGRGLDSS